jgi:Ca2+-binding EF-hand superfamily protein
MSVRWANLRRPVPACALAVAGSLAWATLASAQQPPAPSPAQQMFAPWIMQGLTAAPYLERRRAVFRSLDVDHDGALTVADREHFRMRAMAGVRANVIVDILRADLDSDGLVTRDEVVKLAIALGWPAPAMPREDEARRRKRIENEIAERMKPDLDHNGVIDAEEMMAYAKQRAEARPFNSTADPGLVLDTALMLDADGDGKVTLAEYEAAAEGVFRAVDTDGDGVVSKDEIEAYRRHLAPAQKPTPARPAPISQPAPPPDPRQVRENECAMPPVPAGARVALVGAWGAAAVSSVALGSQDVTTSAARVTIEEGSEPLYVVLVSSGPVIWQVDGAVARVVRAYLLSNHARYPNPLPGIAAGVTGLPREVVTFAARPGCIKSFTDRPTIDAALAVGAVRRRAGQEPLAVVATSQAEHLWLPSGRHDRSGETLSGMKTMHIERSTRPLTAASVREQFAEAFPAGVARIEPAAVIAGQLTEPYEVLPNRAGLLDLLDQGKLVPGRGQEFVVRDKIRFPAELDSSYRFRIPAGVAMPDGNPGQACVIVEDGHTPPTRTCH